MMRAKTLNRTFSLRETRVPRLRSHLPASDVAVDNWLHRIELGLTPGMHTQGCARQPAERSTLNPTSHYRAVAISGLRDWRE